MDSLLPLAARAGDLLKARGETIAVAESTAGGLISAALLAVPGASAYFLGGAVVYTRIARAALLNIPRDQVRPSSEDSVALLAQSVRAQVDATWGLAESGIAGPTGPAGRCFLAVSGPVEFALTIETGLSDRIDNMRAFGREALALMLRVLDSERA